jgi:long-subunit acyl-CoA synthetase (AMP-forming)
VTLVMLPPDADVGTHLKKMDARAAVSDDGVRHGVIARPASTPHTWQPEGLAGPADPPETLRTTTGPATPEARFLLRTSGTTGEPTWVALSDRNVLSVLASHMPHMQLQHARTLSVLPWTHAFGLVLDFLPALLSETEIIRDPNGGRDPGELLRLARAWGATHLSAVPLVIDRIAEVDGGPGMLCSLTGGIVGGAPVSGSLAQLLSGTSLRAGYGQTEASPGIALGPPGHWSANYMGRPLGCSVDIDEHGELHFEGDNACIGIWEDGALSRLDPDRRVATGDRVSRDGDDLFFRGRTDNTFKLSNGRLVAAGHIESVVKQRFRRVDEAFLFSPDGDNVALAVRLNTRGASPPSVDAVSAAIGSVSERLIEIVAIPPEDWKNTPKGTVARDDMSAFLRRTFSASPSSSSSPSVSSS